MDRVFSFLLWPKREARGPWKQGRKKRGSITYRTDRANEANKMFIIWLWWLFRFWKGDREPEVRTATYGPGIDQSQHAKSFSHIIRGYYLFNLSYNISWKTIESNEQKRNRALTVNTSEDIFSSYKNWLFCIGKQAKWVILINKSC